MKKKKLVKTQIILMQITRHYIISSGVWNTKVKLINCYKY